MAIKIPWMQKRFRGGSEMQCRYPAKHMVSRPITCTKRFLLSAALIPRLLQGLDLRGELASEIALRFVLAIQHVILHSAANFSRACPNHLRVVPRLPVEAINSAFFPGCEPNLFVPIVHHRDAETVACPSQILTDAGRVGVII